MIIFLIGVALLFIGIIINCAFDDTNPGIYFGTLLACIGVTLLTVNHYETSPSAMDVYRGKTTLEITYKDGVPVDSIAVFKEK